MLFRWLTLTAMAIACVGCDDSSTGSTDAGNTRDGAMRDDASAMHDANVVKDGHTPLDGASSDATVDSGPPPTYDTCEHGGIPGDINTTGEVASPTGTYSNWSWPPASNSFEWTLQIERDPTTDGYYWAHQFGFAGGGGGYFGLQAHGSYRPDPGGNVVVITKMLVFAIADSVALDAELGDIPGPNARVENDFDGGSGWNIHMRYAWEPCHVYALRVGIRDVETNGDRWYGAWIRDLAGGNEIYVGRIRVAASAGRLGSQSVMWSERFGGPAITTCEVQEHSSVVFSVPTSDSGAHTATLLSNAFSSPRYCPNSRFTELQGFVRQEMGVPAE